MRGKRGDWALRGEAAAPFEGRGDTEIFGGLWGIKGGWEEPAGGRGGG